MKYAKQCVVCKEDYVASRKDQRCCGKSACRAELQRGYALGWYYRHEGKEEPYSVTAIDHAHDSGDPFCAVHPDLATLKPNTAMEDGPTRYTRPAFKGSFFKK